MRIHCRGAWQRRLVVLFLGVSVAARAAPVLVEVRDSATGAFVDAVFVLGDGHARDWPKTRTDLGLAPGQWQAKVSAPGYRSIDTTLAIAADGPTAFQLWLDPLVAAKLDPVAPGRIHVSGHVHDREQRAPVPDIIVRLAHLTARTDAQGRFDLEFSARDGDADAGRADTLIVEAPGRAPLLRTLRLTPGSHHLILDLGGDRAEPPPDHRFDQRELQWLQDDIAWPERAPTAPILQPPTNLRVGFADAGFTTPCCVGGCSAVAVMSLETYVQRGLNDEWIASWNGHSLRAGAVAYRSYGAWHVANPRSASYDICSSACCQVNDPDTSASTNAAVAATAGIMLERIGDIFRAEYSAENNAWDDPADGLSCSNADLVCGDGYVGSPAANWPCLADSVASGHGCFGHGRGMSQWGTQRWALNQGQPWPWIVNHYFNANGSGSGLRSAALSSPLRIDTVAAVPASAPAGTTLAINFAISNLAGSSHAAVFLGASLYRSGIGYVSDPAHDLGVALNMGANAVSRPFVLPTGLPDGNFDLLVTLYLDIDGNAAINSGDLALTTTTLPGAVTISTLDAVFANGFEATP